MKGASDIAKSGIGFPAERLVERICCTIALLVLVGTFAVRFSLFQTRWLNPDEFEHLHAAWCQSEGLVPYRDFFEHHTPWFYWLLLPLVKGAHEGPDMAVRSVLLARGLCVVLTATALGAVVCIGVLWGRSGASRPQTTEEPRAFPQRVAASGVLAGLVAATLLAGMPMFLDKSMEIRPDVPAVLLWACALAFLARGIRDYEQGESLGMSFVVSGLCLGGAIMCTQKLLFAVPGFVLGGLLWVLFGGADEERARRLRCAALSAAAGLIPPLLTWAWFAAHRAGYVFVYNNFLLNARWRSAEPPEPLLARLAESSWPVLLLAWGGVVVLCLNFIRRKAYDWFGVVLLGSLTSFLLGLLVIPVAFAQYFLPILPLVALFAGRFTVFLAHQVPNLARPVYIGLVLVLVQATPVSYALGCRHWRNDGQIAALQFVLANTTPNDMVMDGWRGMGVFRPHAWYYYFLHPEVRGMLPPAELAVFLSRLESGEVKPKLIVMDNNLRLLSDRLVAFVERQYEVAGGDMWLRKADVSAEPQLGEPAAVASGLSAANEKGRASVVEESFKR